MQNAPVASIPRERGSRPGSLLLLGMLYLAPVLTMLLWAWRSYKVGSLTTILLATVLEAALVAACVRTWRRFFLVHLPLFALTIAYAIYTVLFGILPGHALALLMVTTSWEEVSGVFIVSQQKWLVVAAGGVVLGYLMLVLRLPRIPIFSGKTYVAARTLLVLSVPLAAYAARDPAQLIDGLALNPTVGSVMFVAGRIPEAINHAAGGDVHKVPYHARRTSIGEEVHVLVVGESARRASWSVYGYERPTTPNLEHLRHEVIFLKNMRADANLTSWAVPMLLTGLPPAQIVHAPMQGDIFDLAREAGYSTAWLVNQDMNVTELIGIKPERLVNDRRAPSTGFGSTTFDETLLPAYRQELARAGRSRFIGLHIMQSHWEYYKRYPPGFQHYGSTDKLSSMSLFLSNEAISAQLRDAYDNSVLYTDWFLDQVIAEARKVRVPATVTFTPDHGEALRALDPGFPGHGGPHYEAPQYEIPAFVWVNDAYRQAHPEIVAALERNSGKEIRSHNVFYTMATLMGITWPNAREAQSFASDQFVPDNTHQYIAAGVLVKPPEFTVAAVQSPGVSVGTP